MVNTKSELVSLDTSRGGMDGKGREREREGGRDGGREEEEEEGREIGERGEL